MALKKKPWAEGGEAAARTSKSVSRRGFRNTMAGVRCWWMIRRGRIVLEQRAVHLPDKKGGKRASSLLEQFAKVLHVTPRSDGFPKVAQDRQLLDPFDRGQQFQSH